jgi:hypothetical protein
VAAFLDALLGPSAADKVIEELRASGEQPDVLAALEARDFERALSLLLDQVAQADGDERERIRQLMVAVFAELGQDHPLTVRFRRQLASALY